MIALLLVLLLASSAGAGQYKGNELCLAGPTLAFEVPCSIDTTGELRVVKEDPCLATMEAAMRAMEPWMPHRLAERRKNGDAHVFPDGSLTAVLEQMESAKRECWRNP